MANQYVTVSAAWFTLSLINAGLAQSKGRHGFRWWFASLFLSPFATLLIVASPPVEPGERAPEVMGRAQATIVGLVAVVAVLGIILLVIAVAGGG